MFSYLKYFFWTSIIVILAGASLFGLSYHYAAGEIIKNQVEQINLSLGKSFSNTVWNAPVKVRDPRTGNVIESDYGTIMQNYFYNLNPEDRAQYMEYVEFTNKTRSLIQDLEIVKVNIYTPQGGMLLSTNQIKTLNATDEAAYRIDGVDDKYTPTLVFNNGKQVSEIIYSANYTKPSGVREHGSLVRTLIPIKPANLPDNLVSDPLAGNDHNVQAVMEIYFDVTDNVGKLRTFQYLGAGFIIVVFMILYLTLNYTTRRAEKIIERQHDTNIELASAKARAEAENQQKSQFLANISHELRTPLNAIIGFSEIIKDEVMGKLNNEQYENYIKDIHSSGVHLLSLINDILDYSKAEAGRLDIEYEDIDLTKLITSSLRLQEPRAKTAEVELIKELPSEHLLIRSDAKRLKQILLNLLSNAVKFTPANGIVKISAWKHFAGSVEMVTIEVKDTGIGIAPKDIAKAFAPFGQVDSELSRRFEGTGLGLPLTKKFVELLGGELRLTSEVNKGTTVTASLPINNDPKGGLTPRIMMTAV